MKSKCIKLVLASVILPVLSGQASAKRLNHDVTPANIDKLLFSATVEVENLGKRKDIRSGQQKRLRQ